MLLFSGSLALNLLAWYGGIRSPDSEVVFELCEAIHDRRSIAVEGVSRFEGFGLAEGKDGRQYSIFGPVESLACAPMLTVARMVDWTHWYEPGKGPRPSPSFYVTDGYESFLSGRRPRDPVLHAERAIVSLLNVPVGALGVVFLWLIARQFASGRAAPLLVAILYAGGTPAWAYAGTFFSEPLATLLVLVSVRYALLRTPWSPAVAGAFVGLATGAHLTALLFLPLVAGLAVPRAQWRSSAARFLAGLVPVLAALAAYNWARFGNPVETGRFGTYGHAVAPWRPLVGLLVSPGKGLLVYAPAVVPALIVWRWLHRKSALVSWLIAATAVLRLLVLATRDDWHGGFCLGPRLLVMLVPFLLLPLVPWLDAKVATRGRGWIAFLAFSTACIWQQAFFAIGEPFSWYQEARIAALHRHVDLFVRDRIYFDPSYAPALHLLEGERGPWLLRGLAVGNAVLWVLLCAILTALCWLAVRLALRPEALSRPRGGSGGR